MSNWTLGIILFMSFISMSMLVSIAASLGALVEVMKRK